MQNGADFLYFRNQIVIIGAESKKTTLLGGLFDGECPYGDPSRTLFWGKSHFSIIFGSIILGSEIVKER